MKLEFHSVDLGWAQLKKTVRALKQRGSYVKVGVLGAKGAKARKSGDKTPLTNVDLAYISEFGSKTQPARPFIGSTFEKNKAEYQGMIQKGLLKVYDNELDPRQLLGLVGAKMAADIKERVMSSADLAPNSPSTIAKKGSDRPLVDTGRLAGSVAWEVVEKE